MDRQLIRDAERWADQGLAERARSANAGAEDISAVVERTTLSTARENILARVRSSLRRPDGAAPTNVPPVRLSAGELPLDVRIEQFCSALELLAGKTFIA